MPPRLSQRQPFASPIVDLPEPMVEEPLWTEPELPVVEPPEIQEDDDEEEIVILMDDEPEAVPEPTPPVAKATRAFLQPIRVMGKLKI